MSLEVAAVSVGVAVMKNVAQIWIGDDPILSAMADAGSKGLEGRLNDHFNRRKVVRFIEECVDIVATRLLRSLKVEIRDLDKAEVEATTLAVADTLEAAQVDLRAVIAADFDPRRVEESLRNYAAEQLRRAHLSEGGEQLYRYLLRECCQYIAQVMVNMPTTGTESIVELLRRQSTVLEQLKHVLDQLPDHRSISDFTTDYARVVSIVLDRMELFGVRLHEKNRSYPLNIAYLGLSVKRILADPYSRPTGPALSPNATWSDTLGTSSSIESVPVEDVVANKIRFLLIGEAGSGKTTLLRWIAVQAARRKFQGPLSNLNGTVPFYIPLRRYVGQTLPSPETFIDSVASAIAGEMPRGWAHRLLRDGSAIILVDGVDELPERQREQAGAWLEQLLGAFPKARFIVTSRPGAISPRWELGGFAQVELVPMTPVNVEAFIAHWYEAARHNVQDLQQLNDLRRYEESLVATLERDRHLRRLAVNPLLCALLCALNREMRMQLPRSRMEIYDAALAMLLDQRDRERGVAISVDLTRTEKTILLQDFALWLVRNGKSSASSEDLTCVIDVSLTGLRRKDERPEVEVVLRHLVERSGLLRQPVIGEIDFIHKTFQEYLAGRAAISNNAVGELARNAGDDQWRDVIVMAAGHASPVQCAALLKALLDKVSPSASRISQGNRPPIGGGRRGTEDYHRLLVAACLQTAVVLDADLRSRVEAEVEKLMPPKSLDVARTLAQAGDFVLDLLPMPANEPEFQAVLETARLIGGPDAIKLIARIVASYKWPAQVSSMLVNAWQDFPVVDFASIVLSKLDWSDLVMDSNEKLIPGLPYLTNLKGIRHTGGVADLCSGKGSAGKPYGIRQLEVRFPPRAEELTMVIPPSYNLMVGPVFMPVKAAELDKAMRDTVRRKELAIDAQDFPVAKALRDSEKRYYRLRENIRVDLRSAMPHLKELRLLDFDFSDLGWLPLMPAVSFLQIVGPDLIDFTGFDRVESLESLAILAPSANGASLDWIPEGSPNLRFLELDFGSKATFNLESLAGLQHLVEITVRPCGTLDLGGLGRTSRSLGIGLHMASDQVITGNPGHLRLLRDLPIFQRVRNS